MYSSFVSGTVQGQRVRRGGKWGHGRIPGIEGLILLRTRGQNGKSAGSLRLTRASFTILYAPL